MKFMILWFALSIITACIYRMVVYKGSIEE